MLPSGGRASRETSIESPTRTALGRDAGGDWPGSSTRIDSDASISGAAILCPKTASAGARPVPSFRTVFSLASEAAARIGAGALDDGTVDGLSRALGVSARHLRRAMRAELGVS